MITAIEARSLTRLYDAKSKFRATLDEIYTIITNLAKDGKCECKAYIPNILIENYIAEFQCNGYEVEYDSNQKKHWDMKVVITIKW